jgi:hypothetical protein
MFAVASDADRSTGLCAEAGLRVRSGVSLFTYRAII